jgi:GT2 family glycosyltransferase
LPPHRIIVVDDGSKQATRAYLNEFSRSHDDVTLLRNDRVLGYTQSANIGMKFSDAPFVILLNSDTVVSRQWALKLLQAANSGPEVGVVGPMSNAASWQSVPLQQDPRTGAMAINEIPEGMTVADMNRLCEQHGWFEHFPRVPLVNGFCYGIKREVLDAIGYFDDEAFPVGYGEEDDFSMRALDAGFVHALATHCYVFHTKSKSFRKRIRTMLTRAGGRALRDRHGEIRLGRAFDTMKTHPQLRRIRIEIGRACGVEVNEILQSRLSLPAGYQEHESTPAGAARSATRS